MAMQEKRDLEKGRYRENKERFERPMDMMRMELPKIPGEMEKPTD